MARGRTLFSEHRRRAASVPVDDLSYPDTATTSKLYNIRSDVAHDTDALLSASRRHDRDFLHKVQSKLVSPPTFTKTPPTLNHNRYLGPPPSRSAYYAATAAASIAAVPSSAPRDLRRRTWYGPTANRVDDYEVASYLATPIRPPYVSRVLRSGSVPPVLPSTATAPRWFHSSHVRGSSVPRWAPSTYRTYGSGRSYLQKHPDMEDIVVGVAPTTQYGDIVIGIPYRKQFMFGVQHGLDADEDYHPRVPVATRVTSPYFAHRNTPLLRTYDDVDLTPYHGSRYTAPGYGARSSISSYPSYTHSSVSTAAPARFSTIGYPVRASSARYSVPVHTEYDFDLYGSKAPKESLSNLRLRTSLAHDKAKSLDRYIPTETLSRAPAVAHYVSVPLSAGGHQVFSPVSAPVAASSGAFSSKPFKPQVSETRQRVRDLLCKSKKDPHYFD